jgi:hypothetical protein
MNPRTRYLSLISLIVLAGAGLEGQRAPRPWTTSEKVWAGTAVTALAADMASTVIFLNMGIPESNPVLGRHPSTLKVGAWFAAGAAGTVVAAHFFPKQRKLILIGVAVFETVIVVYDVRAMAHSRNP